MTRYLLIGIGAAIGAGIGLLFDLVGVGIALGAAGGLLLAYYSKR